MLHLAWALVTPDGNPVPNEAGRIDWVSEGPRGAITASRGDAVAQLLQEHARLEQKLGVKVVIAAEILDFSRSKAELRYRSPELARKLSSFAYTRFNTILDARCAQRGTELRRVGAAWSSVLGQASYAAPYGLSVDQAACVVLGRRANGMQSKIRPEVQARLLACDEQSEGDQKPKRVTLGRATRALGPRSSTWDKGGLARRGPQALAPPAHRAQAPRLEPSTTITLDRERELSGKIGIENANTRQQLN